MSRYERHQYFESLCEMRAAYGARPMDDRQGTLLVEDAIRYGDAVMLALEFEDAEIDEAIADSAAAERAETSIDQPAS